MCLQQHQSVKLYSATHITTTTTILLYFYLRLALQHGAHTVCQTTGCTLPTLQHFLHTYMCTSKIIYGADISKRGITAQYLWTPAGVCVCIYIRTHIVVTLTLRHTHILYINI